MNYSFARYLEAKQSVDDRALNRGVWDVLLAELPKRPLEILEVGAGTGTMIARLANRGLPDGSHYVAVDSDPINIRAAEHRLSETRLPFNVTLHAADVFEYLDPPTARTGADLLIAHAFLDLFNLRTVVPVLLSALAPAGLFYFTLNFDGQTEFEPTIDPALDDLIVSLYHRTMDERVVKGLASGDSRSGRHLFEEITAADGEVLAAGGSDWVVYPHDGAYPADEAYFLHHILHFVETSLAGNPNLDTVEFQRWLAIRHAQIEKGELVYIAHQLDFVGRLR